MESVSNVDVVCTDKTGTLTTGRLTVHAVGPVGPLGTADVERLVGSMARGAGAANLTSAALAAALPGEAQPVREEIPFSSSLRWSALRTDDGVLVLGAPDALAPRLSGPPLTGTVSELTSQGLRVLAVDPHAELRDEEGRPLLPALEPLAVVSLAGELRPDVRDTLARFARDDIAVKVVSGDDPRTVAALARQAGL